MQLMNKTFVGAATLDVKELTDSGTISGYASVFGNIDQGGDRVMVGAYAKSLASGRKIKMLWQHDTHEVIGGWNVAREDAKGLWVEGQFNMDVQRGREAHALMKAGQIEGLSIGYRIPQGGAKKASDGAYELHEIDLREVSVVTMPMNEMATASAKAQVEVEEVVERLKAGVRPTEREFEKMLRGEPWGFSKSQAERAARVCLKGQGEPDDAAQDARALLMALRG